MNADDEGALRRSQSGAVAKYAAPTGSAARNKRQDEFNQLFELTHEELLEDYSCAYQSDKLLYHGRMYVSRNYICFHSQIFKKTIKILEFKDIQDVQKKNTAIVFPNALELTAKNRKFMFASFIYRDQAYKLVFDLWEESKRNKVFKSLAVKEARRKHEEDLAREASFEATSEPSTEEESEEEEEEGEEETGPSDGESYEEAVPPALPRSAPTPVGPSPYTSDSVSLAPPDDGSSSAKSLSPPPTSTQPSPPSNSALRNLSVNISQNVNGWVNSVGWPINKLRADDGSGEHPEELKKRDIELREFSSDGEGRVGEDAGRKPDEESRPSSPEDQREASLKEPERDSASLATATEGTVLTEAEAKAAAKDDGGDREPSVASLQKTDDTRSKEKEDAGGGDGEEKPERGSGSRRKRREDKERAEEAGKPPEAPPVPAQTAVPTLEACAHITAGWSSGQSMVNVLLPIAVGDMWYTFFDDKNPEAASFWNELHAQEPLSYTELSMGQWSLQAENCCLRRSVGFRVALKHPLGPKSTRVQQEQRIHYINKDTLVMETTSSSLDVPYGDTFTTDTRWVMCAATGPNGKPATRVTVNVDIKFTKNIWIKGVIQSSAVDGVSTYFPAWADKAQRLLARKARAAVSSSSPTKRTPRKGASTRSSKRSDKTPGGETPSKLRKSRRRASGEKEDLSAALASASGATLDEVDEEPTFMSTQGFVSPPPSTPREEESLVESLVHMVFPSLPIPRLPFSLTAVAGAVLLLALAFFLLPPLFSLPSLSGRVASLESDIHALRRVNAHLKDRVLFMQLALSSLTTPSPDDDHPAGRDGPPPRDALPELWRYWKLHRLLRERVNALIAQLHGVHSVLGQLHDDDAAAAADDANSERMTTAKKETSNFVGDDEFLRRLARALDDAAATGGDDILSRWSVEEEDVAGSSGLWSWVWALFKLVFLWLPLVTAIAAFLANTLGLLPPVLPFALPLENALRPYVSFLPLPPAFNDSTTSASASASSTTNAATPSFSAATGSGNAPVKPHQA